MTRNLKMLGLAFVAMLAMGAMASAAQAELADFNAETGTKFVTGIQEETRNQIFTTTAGQIRCNGHFVAHKDGEDKFEEPTLTVETVKYDHCVLAGAVATVNFTDCDYHFTAGTMSGNGSVGTADLRCPVGQSVHITVPGCNITVHEQKNLGPVNYKNVTTPSGQKVVTVEPHVANIKSTHAGFICGNGQDEKGTYTGTAWAHGKDIAGEPTDVEVTGTK